MEGKEQKTDRRSPRNSALPRRMPDRKGWRIRWIDLDGKRRSKVFPESGYEAALAELRRIHGEMQAVKDGRHPAPKIIPSFVQFIDDYWRPNRMAYKRSQNRDESVLRVHLLPAFGQLPLNLITLEQVELFKTELGKKKLNPKTVHNILTILIAILNYALELDIIYRVPKIKKPKIYEDDYNYLQSDNEIRAFLSTAEKFGDNVYALFATAVYTGMRAGELFGLRWSDVVIKRGLIAVKRSYDKPTKSGKMRYVPILDVLAPILKEWRLKNSNEFVFPNEAGKMHTQNPRITKYTFPAVLKAAELDKIRFHDLRHTFASHWVMKGGDLYKLKRILGHSDIKMTMRYAHLAPEAFDEDRAIFGSVPPSEGAVVPLLQKQTK